jgi:hypothetical protein
MTPQIPTSYDFDLQKKEAKLREIFIFSSLRRFEQLFSMVKSEIHVEKVSGGAGK